MGTKFLLIEDDTHWRNVIAETIVHSFKDAHVAMVYSLADAIKHMASEKYDLIISGLYEYGDVGGRAFEEILTTANSTRTPVIFISSFARPDDVFRAAKLGAYDFMIIERVNFSIADLLSSVESALRMRYAPKAFISYSSPDKKFVKRLADTLQSSGVRVWWDSWEIKVGDSISKKIEEGIASSSYLIIVLSPASVSSRWVQEELSAALIRQISDRDIHILPVLKADCAIPPLLRSRKYADFRKGFKTAFEDLYKALITVESS